MLIYMLAWWYTTGWSKFARSIFAKERGLADYFSIGLLFRTWFEPFRQISAGGASSDALDARWRAFTDKLVSRIIGFFTRSLIMLAGIIAMAGLLVINIVLTLCWPLLPLMPIAGIVLCGMGVKL